MRLLDFTIYTNIVSLPDYYLAETIGHKQQYGARIPSPGGHQRMRDVLPSEI